MNLRSTADMKKGGEDVLSRKGGERKKGTRDDRGTKRASGRLGRSSELPRTWDDHICTCEG